MKRFTFAVCFLFLALFSSLAIAGKPQPAPGAIVSLALFDVSGNPYYVRPSDGKGDLINNVDCTTAEITAAFGLNVYINQCSKKTPPQRTMEVNLFNPAQGQNPIADFSSLTNFHIVTPTLDSLTAVGQTLDIDLGLTFNNYKVRYGEGGTPFARVTCTAAANNLCTTFVITPGGGTDLALVFDTNGNNFGQFHIPFYMTVTRQ